MKILLIVVMASLKSVSITTEPFADKQSCANAGYEIKEFVESNDMLIGDTVRFTCIEVTGK